MLQTRNLEDLLFSHRPTYARKQGLPAPLEIFGCALIGIMNTCPALLKCERHKCTYIHVYTHIFCDNYDDRITTLSFIY